MKFKLIGLIIIVALAVGCQPVDRNDTTEIVYQASELNEWLPQKIGLTRFFNTENGQVQFESLLKIETLPSSNQTHYYFEGERLSSEKSFKDTGYLSHVVVDSDKIYQKRQKKETLLLKAPVIVGQKWETYIWVPDTGWVSATGQIEDVNDNEVRVVLKSNVLNCTWRYTFRKNIGIVKQYFFSSSHTYRLELNAFYDELPFYFVNRYYQVEDKRASYYKKNLFFYEATISEFNYVVSKLTKNRVYRFYENTLRELDKTDIRTINVAAEITRTALSKDPTDYRALISFLAYYKKVRHHIDDNIEDYLDHETLHDIYTFDELSKEYIFKAILPSNPKVGSMSKVLQENGVGIRYLDGKPKSYPMHGYLSEKFKGLPFDIHRFIALVEQGYFIRRELQSENIIDWDSIASHIKDIEILIKDNDNKELLLYFSPKLNYFKKIYLSPVAEKNSLGNKFEGGILNEEIKVSYNNTLAHYQDSDLYKAVSDVYRSLQKNSWVWTSEYEDTLMKLGFDLTRDNQRYGYSPYAEEQIKAYHLLSKTERQPANLSPVYVSTVDEFIQAIGPDKTIVLKSGLFVLETATSTEYAKFTLGKLIIQNVDNLTIMSESPHTLAHLVVNTNATVLQFERCSNIQFIDIRFAREEVSASTPLLSIQHTQDVNIKRCVFSGKSGFGIEMRYSENVNIANSIFNNIQGPLARLEHSNKITFEELKGNQLGAMILSLSNSKDVLLRHTTVHQALNQHAVADDIIGMFKSSLIVEACNFHQTTYDIKQYKNDNFILR